MQEIVHELFSSLEALETQSTAILQFLKDKGLADEKGLAPFLEQSGNASSVRWRAARVRIDYLISSAIEAEERDAKKEPPAPKKDSQESSADTGGKTSAKNEGDKKVQGSGQDAPSEKSQGSDADAGAQKSRSQPDRENENDLKNESVGTGENAREKAA